MEPEGTKPRKSGRDPSSAGKIIETGFSIYGQNLVTLLTIAAMVMIPIAVLAALLSGATLEEVIVGGERAIERPDDVSKVIAGAIGLVILTGLGGLLATGASFKAVADAYLGREPDRSDSISFALSKLPGLLWVSILVALAIGLGLLALVIPGIYLMVALSIAVPVLLVEDIRGTKALGRSRELIKGDWWTAFGAIAVGVIIIPGVITAVISAIFGGVFIPDDAGFSTQVGLGAIGDLIGWIITTPMQAAVTIVLYFEMRRRKEGYVPDLTSDASPLTDPTASPFENA